MALSSPFDDAVAVNTPSSYTVGTGVYVVQVYVGAMAGGDTVEFGVAVPGRDTGGTGGIYSTHLETFAGVQDIEVVQLGPFPVLEYDGSGGDITLTATRTAGTITSMGVRILKVA